MAWVSAADSVCARVAGTLIVKTTKATKNDPRTIGSKGGRSFAESKMRQIFITDFQQRGQGRRRRGPNSRQLGCGIPEFAALLKAYPDEDYRKLVMPQS